MTSNEDLKELGIAMGHRKKLSSFVSSQGEKIRAAKVRWRVASEGESEIVCVSTGEEGQGRSREESKRAGAAERGQSETAEVGRSQVCERRDGRRTTACRVS